MKSARKVKRARPVIEPGGVDEYIAASPKEARGKLSDIRTAIRSVTPGAIETVSYFEMPGYSYEGYVYNGMFAWFSFKAPFVRLHVRPEALVAHKEELEEFDTTRAVVSFPVGKKIPAALVKRLVRASLRSMKQASK